MGIFDWTKKTFAGLGGGEGGMFGSFRGGTETASRASESSQLEAYHEVPPFFVAVDRIAESFASLTWEHRLDGRAISEHEAVKLHRQPHPDFTGYEFRALMQKYVDIAGDAIAVVIGSGSDIELWPVPPHAAEIQKNDDGDGTMSIVWEIEHSQIHVKADPEDVFHLKRTNLSDPYGKGLGLGSVLSDELEIAENAAEFEKSEFENQARPDLLVDLNGAGEDAAEQFRERWKNKFQGPSNAGEPFIQGGTGEIDVQTLSPPIKDTKLAELRELSNKEVARAFGIPPTMIGRVESTTRATAHMERLIFARQITIPRAKRWRIAWDQQILSRFDDNIEFDFKDPRPDDLERRRKGIKEHPQAFTENEKRKEFGYAPREGLDIYLRKPVEKQREVPAQDFKETESESVPDKGHVCKHCKESSSDSEVMKKITKQNLPSEALAVGNHIKKDQIADDLVSEYLKLIKDAVREHARDLNEDPERIMDLINQELENHLNEFRGGRLDRINDTTRDQIQKIIAEAIRQNRPPKEVVDNVKSYETQIDRVRSDAIGTTEMLVAANFARLAVGRNSRKVTGRRWVTTLDGQARVEHLRLNGEVVGMNEPFRVDGHQAMYPGDFQKPDLDINCRCTTTPVTKKSADTPIDGMSLEKQWRQFHKKLSNMESEFSRLAKTTLTRQLRTEIIPATRQVLDVD